MDHDAAHKYIYTLVPVIADLLRLVVPDWADDLDLAAPENVSTEYLDEDHRRVGDMAWKVYFRNGQLADGSRPYILLLVEFQSSVDRDMARRVREYTDMLLDRLIRNDVMSREGGLPQTLAVVVYNGGERWTAIGEESHLAQVPSARARRDLALLQPQLYRRVDTGRGAEQDWPKNNLVAATARLQSATTPDQIGPRLLTEAQRFAGPALRAFRQAMHAWAKASWANEMGAEAAFPSFEELEQEKQEMATILQERWAARRAEERELGRAEGRELGLVQGRELGRADERTRLRRQAALKFGAGTADQLADRLADLTAFEDLDRVADWIIECESGDELLSRLHFVAST